MAVPSPLKGPLRKEARDRRDAHHAALGLAGRCSAAVMLRQHALDLFGDAAGTVAAYLPINSEVDPVPLVAALAEASVEIALPYVNGRSGTPRFIRWSPGDPLDCGPLGLRQPCPKGDEVAPDIILAPLLAFDARLNRIGYGAGHYDRAFLAHPAARRIGLAWACQQVDEVPVDPWDEPLQAVVTEAGVIA